jgi:hypothetical protein
MTSINKNQIINAIKNNKDFEIKLIEIIESLKNYQKDSIDKIIENLFRIMMEILSSKDQDFVTIDMLDERQKKLLMAELKEIIISFTKSSTENIVDILIQRFLQSYSNNVKKLKEEDHFRLSEKDKKQIKEELLKMAIYEEYKALNPKRIAGETSVENFLNNMIIGGIEHASKYEGGKNKNLDKYSKELIDELEKAHSTYKKPTSRGR